MVNVGRDINSIFGDQKTPEGEINSIIGWATQGNATQTPASQDNSTAQTGVVTNADVKSTQVPVWYVPEKSTEKSTLTPASDLLGNPNANLANTFKNQAWLNPAWYDATGDLILNKTVIGYPNLNDSALKTIQAGIPTSKSARSGIGLPNDLGMSIDDINSTVQLLQRYIPKYTAENGTVGASMSQQLNQMMAVYNQAKQSGNAAATAEALAQLKLTLGWASNTVAWRLNGKKQSGLTSIMEEEDEQLLWNTKNKAQEFMTYYNTSGQDLNNYLQNALTPDTTTYQVKAENEWSRIAKQEMISNPYYLQFLEQVKYTDKMAYDKLVTDATSDTITYYEKQFIKSFGETIDKIKEQRKSYADKYGWKVANEMYSGYQQLFELQDLQYKTYMDDIMDSMYAGIQSSSQQLLLDFSSPLFR